MLGCSVLSAWVNPNAGDFDPFSAANASIFQFGSSYIDARPPRRSPLSASLIGRLGSSVFRLSTAAVSMSLAGSCFSSESAPRPFQYGIRERGGTIYWAALPLNERQVQADKRTHLIHRPARDIFPPLGGARVFSYRIWSFTALMLPLLLGSSGTRCRQPICGA